MSERRVNFATGWRWGPHGDFLSLSLSLSTRHLLTERVVGLSLGLGLASDTSSSSSSSVKLSPKLKPRHFYHVTENVLFFFSFFVLFLLSFDAINVIYRKCRRRKM